MINAKGFLQVSGFAVSNEGTSANDYIGSSLANTPAAIKDGCAGRDLILLLDLEPAVFTAGGVYFAMGNNGFTNGLTVHNAGTNTMQVRLGGGVDTNFSIPLGDSVNVRRQLLIYMRLTDRTFFWYANGIKYSSGAGDLPEAFTTGNVNAWPAFINTGIGIFGRAGGTNNSRGTMYDARVWYAPSANYLTNAQVRALAESLYDTGTDGGLLNAPVFLLAPDETDAATAAATIRDQANAGHNLTYFSGAQLVWREGETSAAISSPTGATNYATVQTATDTVFDVTQCLWEFRGVSGELPTAAGTQSAMGDTANILGITEAAGEVTVRFKGAQSPAAPKNVARGAVVTYQGMRFTNGDCHAAYNGYRGAAVNVAAPVSASGTFSLLANGNAANRMTGACISARVFQFDAFPHNDEDVMPIDEVLRYHHDHYPAIHPAIQQMIAAGTCRVIYYDPSKLYKTSGGATFWPSTTYNVVGANDMSIGAVGLSEPVFLRSLDRTRRVLYVGTEDGTNPSHRPGLPLVGAGAVAGPYRGADAVQTALSAQKAGWVVKTQSFTRTGTSTTIVSDAAGTVSRFSRVEFPVVPTPAGAGLMRDLIINASNVQVIGGRSKNQFGVGASIAGSRVCLRRHIAYECNTHGIGVDVAALDAELYNNLCEGNGGQGINSAAVITAKHNITAGNAGSITASAGSKLNHNNLGEGNPTTATKGTYDLVSQPPRFKDLAGNDYSALPRSNVIHSGVYLPGWNASWDQGPFSFFGREGKKFGNRAEVKGLGEIELR